MIKILYFTIEGQLEQSLWNSYLKKLPSNLQSNVTKYYRWQDQYSNLFGKLLLKHGLIEYGYGDDCLDLLNYNSFKKPFIDKKTYFNLSHSSEIVICAFSQKDEIGIDIEEIKENKDFHDILPLFFTIHEQNKILDAKNSVTEFYKLWTRKEAVLKAMGVGLNFKLNEIDVCNNKIKNDSLNVPDLHIKSYKKNNSFISIATTLIPQIRLFEVSNINFLNFFSA